MRILKFLKAIQPRVAVKPKNTIPATPINYDKNNVTVKEFREYINYLAKYKINKTIQEPDSFITEAERAKRNAFKAKVQNLAEKKINKTFLC